MKTDEGEVMMIEEDTTTDEAEVMTIDEAEDDRRGGGYGDRHGSYDDRKEAMAETDTKIGGLRLWSKRKLATSKSNSSRLHNNFSRQVQTI